MGAAILALVLCACSSSGQTPLDPRQTIRDSLFYDGLAAYHEGYFKEAAIRWQRAADFGDGEAARNLGHLYRQGKGVDQDLSIAVAWYQVAADAGVVSAWYNLGMLYYHGGPNYLANRELGLTWLKRAADSGLAPAKAELERIAAAPPAAPVAAEMPPPAAPAPAMEPAPPPPATLRVQVGSYRSAALADEDKKRLGWPGISHEVTAVQIKDKGRWYRLMAVGAPDRLAEYCDSQKPRVACWPGRFGPAFKK